MKLKTPLKIKFKFELDEKWHGFAIIYPTHRGMIREIRKDGIDVGDNTGGLCSSYKKVLTYRKGKKRGVDTGLVCHIFLNEEDLGFETIAHEATHACMGWARRIKLFWKRTHGCAKGVRDKKGVTWVDNEGERWAYAVGRVSHQIAVAYQRKLARKK